MTKASRDRMTNLIAYGSGASILAVFLILALFAWGISTTNQRTELIADQTAEIIKQNQALIEEAEGFQERVQKIAAAERLCLIRRLGDLPSSEERRESGALERTVREYQECVEDEAPSIDPTTTEEEP